jgi:hypothetical protein
MIVPIASIPRVNQYGIDANLVDMGCRKDPAFSGAN